MNVKKIIAREGLVGIILLSGLASLLISIHYRLKGQFYFDKGKTNTLFKTDFFVQSSQYINTSSKFWIISQILLSIYLAYLFVRFIIWAIRTLREGK